MTILDRICSNRYLVGLPESRIHMWKKGSRSHSIIHSPRSMLLLASSNFSWSSRNIHSTKWRRSSRSLSVNASCISRVKNIMKRSYAISSLYLQLSMIIPDFLYFVSLREYWISLTSEVARPSPQLIVFLTGVNRVSAFLKIFWHCWASEVLRLKDRCLWAAYITYSKVVSLLIHWWNECL